MITGLEAASHDLNTLRYSGAMTSNLIDDLMDHAKLGGNKFELNNDFFDLTEIIYETL